MFDRDSNSFIMQNHFDQAELIIQGESGNLWSRATQLRACTTPSVHHLDQDQFQMFQNTPSFPGKLPQAQVSTILMVDHLSLKQRHSEDSCQALRSTMSWRGREANRDAPSEFKLSSSMDVWPSLFIPCWGHFQLWSAICFDHGRSAICMAA